MDGGVMPTPPDEVKLGRGRNASLPPRLTAGAPCVVPLPGIDVERERRSWPGGGDRAAVVWTRHAG